MDEHDDIEELEAWANGELLQSWNNNELLTSLENRPNLIFLALAYEDGAPNWQLRASPMHVAEVAELLPRIEVLAKSMREYLAHASDCEPGC